MVSVCESFSFTAFLYLNPAADKYHHIWWGILKGWKAGYFSTTDHGDGVWCFELGECRGRSLFDVAVAGLHTALVRHQLSGQHQQVHSE